MVSQGVNHLGELLYGRQWPKSRSSSLFRVVWRARSPLIEGKAFCSVHGMSLKSLTTPTMLTVLDAWLDPVLERPKIEALPRAASLLPDLDGARTGLRDSHAVTGKTSPELQKLQGVSALLDGVHDRKARGFDKVTDGLSELTDDEDLAQKLQVLRTEVLGPKGLLGNNSSYVDEAQNTKLVDTRLSPESTALLARITLDDRPLLDWVKSWQDAGTKLGEAEAERVALETKLAQGTQPADAVRARNKAIRVISAFLTMLDLDDPAEEARQAILGTLEMALSRAGRRGGKVAEVVAADE